VEISENYLHNFVCFIFQHYVAVAIHSRLYVTGRQSNGDRAKTYSFFKSEGEAFYRTSYINA